MSDVENEVSLALAGKCSDVSGKFCDFTITRQNESIEAKGVTPKSSSLYVPVCQKTVTYIVAAVIINDKDEVLMIQESKPQCMEKWYLPAGRVEPNENLIDAIKREVLEETGLNMVPRTLIMIECAAGPWLRFVMTGDIVGGSLKTLEQADDDSLQACWIKNVEQLSLRSNDIIPIIQKGRDYIKGANGPWHSSVLPVTNPLNKLYLRVIVCIRRKTTNKMHILVCQDPVPHLPVCEIYPNRSLHSTLHDFMVEIFGENVAQHRPHGVLSVEFGGSQGNDGLCMTELVSFKPFMEDVCIIEQKYVWHDISTSLAEEVVLRLPRNMTIFLHVIR